MRLKVCRIVTVPFVFRTWLYRQLEDVVANDIDLTLISSPGPELEEICRDLPVQCCTLPIVRKPDPWRDVYCVVLLTRLLRREHFDVVHSSTPKAGLLASVAGALARVPVRIHTYTGQPWIELRGPLRMLARECDRLIGRLNTRCYADSASQRDFLIAEGLIDRKKISLLGDGSIGGVDLRRFDPAVRNKVRAATRDRLGMTDSSLGLVFVGRVTKDKGITELVSAFRSISNYRDDLHLLLVGPFEPGLDPLPADTLGEISSNPRIHAVGFASKPEEYLAAGDIFCLPSYREGFGSVVIEAGAMELPSVATRITGVVDAVVDGETGILVPPKDAAALAGSLKELIESPETRYRMGQAARQRALKHFDSSVVNHAVIREYFRLMDEAGHRAFQT